jgi:DNA topoisomerase-1
MKKTDRFQKLTFPGPQLPSDYVQDVFEIQGRKISKDASERFTLLSRYIDTDYWKDATFQKNAWHAMVEVLPDSMKKLTMADILPDLTEYRKKTVAAKEAEKAAMTREMREAKKADTEAKKQQFGFATVDGQRKPIAGYMVEQPGFLITRGKDPRKGAFKLRVKPSDITVNIVGDAVKAAEMKKLGFNVVSDTTVLWVFKYKMTTTFNNYQLDKKIIFAGTSDIGQGQEEAKYDKTILLLRNWDKVQKHIEKAIQSTDVKKRDAGLIAHIIQLTGIRVGNERDLSKVADTLGASTLRGENMSITGDKLTLTFLGKDSALYKNTITVAAYAAPVFQKLLASKKPRDDVFTAGSGDVNALIKEVVDVPPKILRTAVCNITLMDNLKKKTIKASDPLPTKIRAMYEANLEIARTLNHQKNIGKNANEAEAKAKDRAAAAKASLVDVEAKAAEKLRKLRKDVATAKTVWKGDKLKEKLALIEARVEKTKKSVQRAKDRLETSEFKLQKNKDTKEIALGTSLSAYAYPRIIVSWCKEYDVPPEKIYTKSLMARFSNFMDADASFWRKIP